MGSAHLQCQVGWLSLYAEQEGDLGLRIAVLGSGPKIFSVCSWERPQSMMSWCWDPLDGVHVETCVCCLGSPVGDGTGRWGAVLGTVPWLDCMSQAGVRPPDSWTLFTAMP